MFKLRAGIQKDIRILYRDKIGLLLMFVMPILLALLITVIQNSTYELVNDNKVKVILRNDDRGESSQQLIEALQATNLFEWQSHQEQESLMISELESTDALMAIHIPSHFSEELEKKSKQLGALVFSDLGLVNDTNTRIVTSVSPVRLYFHPVLQESFQQSMQGTLETAIQVVENKTLIKYIYASVNEKKSPEKLEEIILRNKTKIEGITATRHESRNLPNATQHNIPAWTIFAMFFIVISLGSSIVKEKLNGSFTRLKTMPGSYVISLVAKEITYLAVTLLQALVIFSLGIYLFPVLNLPPLHLPDNIAALILVTFMCGFCAVSFALCIGVYASTQEQANGFGAVSIVIMAAFGGILVPSFAMPQSFSIPMKFSPLHWCLEAYYDLFLIGGNLSDIYTNILPLVAISIFFLLLSWVGLKRKQLI